MDLASIYRFPAEVRARAVVVTGPPASGKTRNAEALRRHYGKARIVDDWTRHDGPPPPDALVLTQDGVPGAIDIADALRAAGIQQPDA